ncbi:MAG: 3-carboxy-cis,cis-muconate cycloisomerase [Desulfovibrio sp.]
MSAHIMDSEFYQNSWSTEEMRAIFTMERRFDRWLKIEAALARAEAQCGFVPQEAANAITKAADIKNIDLDKLEADLAKANHTLMPLIRQLQAVTEGNHGEYVHFGVATQDIEDTGLAQEMKEAFAIVYRDAKQAEVLLLGLAEKYKTLTMMGRTHNQHGLPTTLGLKFAGMASEMRRNIERMKEARKRLFKCMIYGGVGTQAGLGDKAAEVSRYFAKETGLDLASTSWTNSRDTVAEYQVVLAYVCGTVSRIANEIYQLSRTEILELHEPLGENYIGSSTMPHKRNAEVSEFIVCLCRIVTTNSLLGFQGMMSEHERDDRSWRLDWHGVPESSMLTGKALAALNFILGGIQVYENNIARNLDVLEGQIFAEAVLLHLGRKIGKQTAHQHTLEAAGVAIAKCIPFKEAILASDALAPHISGFELDEICDYAAYTGTAAKQVEAVTAECAALAKTD